MDAGRANWTLLVMLAVMLAAAAGAQTSQDSQAKLARLKAAVIANFVKYTEWPPSAFVNAQSPIRIAVLGESRNNAADYIDETFHLLGTLHDRRLEVVRVRFPTGRNGEPPEQQEIDAFMGDLRRMHVLFLHDSERPRVREILANLGTEPVLTVSDIRGFVDSGGMLGLEEEENRIVFDANAKAIQRTPLKVSSKLLKLARRVVEGRA